MANHEVNHHRINSRPTGASVSHLEASIEPEGVAGVPAGASALPEVGVGLQTQVPVRGYCCWDHRGHHAHSTR